MTRKKILIATQCFAPTIGGIEKYVTDFAHALAQQGYDIDVFADGQIAPLDSSLAAKNIHIRRFSGIKFWRQRRKAHAIQQAVNNTPYQLILCDSWKSAHYLDKVSIPIICLAHGMEYPEKATRKKAKRIAQSLSLCRLLLPNSRFTRDRLTPYLELAFQKPQVEIFHPPIFVPPDMERQTPAKEESRAFPVFCSLGRLEPRKGFDKMIEALPLIAEEFPQTQYHIGGSGDDMARLKALAQKYKVADRVFFHGRIEDTQKAQFFQQADMFVMPNRQHGKSVEGYGIVFLEAALYGLPSIGGMEGGASDAIIDYITGVIIDGNQHVRLAATVMVLAKDKAQLAKMSNAARKHAQTRDWGSAIDKFIYLTQSVVTH